MIEIKSVEFKNFMSYGDYTTKVPIGSLGACLITGEVIDADAGDTDGEPTDRSNGAGKSTTYNALLWALFGRTMHADRPGDQVVNELVGKNCIARVDMKNGDSVTRTRKTAGHDELMVQRDGDTLLSTLSVTPNQQKELNKLYGLDWHAFCHSSFCTQYNRPWFELPDPQRKKELERALRIDRFTYCAAVAKEKYDAALAEQQQVLRKRDELLEQITDNQESLATAQEAESTFEETQAAAVREFEANREARIEQAKAHGRDYIEKASKIDIYNLDDLTARWVAVQQAAAVVAKYNAKVVECMDNARSERRRAAEANAKIAKWREKAGKFCPSCEQSIPHTHSEEKIAPSLLEAKEAEENAQAWEEQAVSHRAKKERLEEQIAGSTPEITLDSAKARNTQRASLADSAKRWMATAKQIAAEKPPEPQPNPHTATIAKFAKRIKDKQEQLDALAGDIERTDAVLKHMGYIYKSYNDRKKIKSFSMAKHRPYLNNRFRYYLDKFRVRRRMELTDALTVDTDGRTYTFMSGGERARVNVAFMFARFDVHRAAFGRQSNVVVLDEVDGRLDGEGIEALVDVVMNDLAPRVDSVLVVSQRVAMRDSFPHQLVVRKENDFSVISEIR